MVFFLLEISGEISACEASHPLRSNPAPWIVSRPFSEKGFRRFLSPGILTRMSKMASIYPLETRKSLNLLYALKLSVITWDLMLTLSFMIAVRVEPFTLPT